MIINVHAGHNPDGKVACGAVGYIKESTENRRVKDAVVSKLTALGHQIYDCTVDDGINESDQLSKICTKCNDHYADLNLSIHFNAGANKIKNGKSTGVEVYVSRTPGEETKIAKNICDAIAELGFTNRGVKNKDFYVIRNTSAPAILIECCFVDDPDDVELYVCEAMADAIVLGLTGKKAPQTSSADTIYQYHRVQVGAYSKLENAIKMRQKLIDEGYDAIIVTY